VAFRDWFTTPKEREERSLRELYGRVAECERAHPPNPREIVRKVMNSRWDDFALPEELEPAVEKLLLAVLKTEPILNPLPPFDAGPNVKTSAELEDAKPYQAAIDILPPLQREFFEKDFGNNKVFGQTKDQIRYRLQAILENPTMARLFTSERSRINFFSAINRSSIILVDTAKDFLKGASANFGKVIISLVLQAVMERAAISEKQRRPVYLIIDEAAEYFDSNIDDLLTEARKYKCGIILAHQYLEQASSGLRASLAANTGIKFAGGVSNADARAMATNMRTSPEFILDQPRLSFAAHIRNVTPQAVSIPVEVGRFEKERRMTDADMKTLMALNRERTSFGPPEIAEPNRPTTPGATSPPRTVTPAAPEDISDEW
jgi:hypothetical protein